MARTAASVPYATRAIVLRVRPLGEKDRVTTLLAPEIGRFAAIARGARATKSKLSAVAQPFVSGRFQLARGKTFDIVAQVAIENAHFHVTSHIGGAAWAAYWCELCDALPERHPEPALFQTLSDALDALDALCRGDEDDAARRSIALLGHWFEARYLAFSGYPSQVGRCVACAHKIVVAAADEVQTVAFSPSRGGTLCGDCARLDAARLMPRVQALRWLHRLERASSPLQVLAGALDNTVPSWAVLSDLRLVLQRSIGVHLDLKLRSRRFLDDVAQRI